MSFETGKIVYFREVGVQNTDETLRIAEERARELGIRSIVVASTRGGTGVKAVEVFEGYNVVVVTHSTGFRSPNMQELEEGNRAKILEGGGKVLTTTHAFGGIGRAIRRKFETIQADEIVANVLRLFGQGMKVACEITVMAADAGLIRTDEDVIAIAGSGRGADTAIVVRPTNVNSFFDLKVREILCKPLL
ncbi:MAG: pyruvate kinase alpha/beta domain-containing protein [Candidatus Bathyarchaeia archaeon]